MEGEPRTLDKSMLFDSEDAPSDDSTSTLQYTRKNMQEASTAEKDASADGEQHDSENPFQMRENCAKKHTEPRTKEAVFSYLNLPYARDALLMMSLILAVFAIVCMTGQQTTDRNKIASIVQTMVVEEGLASIIEERVNTYLKKLEQKVTLVEESTIGLQESISSSKNQITEYEKNAERQLKQLKDSVNTLEKELADLKNEAQRNTISNMNDLRSQSPDEIKEKNYFLIAFIFLLLLLMFLLISLLYKRFGAEPTPGTMRGFRKCRTIKNLNIRQILDAIPRAPPLDDAVCIISFYEDRQDSHKRLLDSTNLPNYRVVCHVVRMHDEITYIPHCKVYLMCVEFSERYVIIEEPGLGLGNLHRTTYDAILKLGGKLIILYTRDPGSRRLYDNERFNNKIYPATHQPELVELNNDGRFFSVYDELTSFQKKTLRQKITECMS